MLASQFVELRRSVSPSYRPLKKLMLATLADGLDCFLDYCTAPPLTRRGRLRSEAERWIFEESAAGYPFSFEWICDGLGLSPSWLRAGIRRLEARLRESAAGK